MCVSITADSQTSEHHPHRSILPSTNEPDLPKSTPLLDTETPPASLGHFDRATPPHIGPPTFPSKARATTPGIDPKSPQGPHDRSLDGCHGSATRALSPTARHPSLNPAPDARQPSLSSAPAPDNRRASVRNHFNPVRFPPHSCVQTMRSPAPQPPRTARFAPDPRSILSRNPAQTRAQHARARSPFVPIRSRRSPFVYVSHPLRTPLPPPQPPLRSHFAVNSSVFSCTKPAHNIRATTIPACNAIPNPTYSPEGFPTAAQPNPPTRSPRPTLAKRAS